MDITSIARDGSPFELEEAMLFDIDYDRDELAFEAILGNNLPNITFLINNGIGVDILPELIEASEDEGCDDITEYLYSQLEDVQEEEIIDTIDAMEDLVINENIESIKERLLNGQTDIEEVARLAAFNGNMNILRFALKKGASDYDEMIRSAIQGGNLSIARYIETVDDRGYTYPNWEQ